MNLLKTSLSVLGICGLLSAQVPDFNTAAARVQDDLKAALAELSKLRKEIAGEKIPLSQRLGALQAELSRLRIKNREASRDVDTTNQDVDNLKGRIKAQKDQALFLSNLLAEYIRNFESQLHIAELQLYEDKIKAAKLAADNAQLEPQAVATRQAEILSLSLDRLHDSLGGRIFAGQGVAADSTGLVATGSFAMIGPMAVFASEDGEVVGTAEQLNSMEPQILSFKDESLRKAVTELLASGAGAMPFDATLGKAHAVAKADDTILDEFHKGGTVMYPIVGMAALALLIALYRWLVLSLQRKPSRRKVKALFEAVRNNDVDGAKDIAHRLRGPAGRMLRLGTEHLGEPKELVEEVMYENVLTTKNRLQKMLPFIAICAASAPLLGLLGTVNGIINTFKMITISGSDIKNLSSGISEALITTKYGLIVAIPALLLNAYLSRKARAIAGHMETTALAFMNQIQQLPRVLRGTGGDDPASRVAAEETQVREQVHSIIKEMLAPIDGGSGSGLQSRNNTASNAG